MCIFFIQQTFTFVDAIIITVEVAAFTSIFHQKTQFSQKPLLCFYVRFLRCSSFLEFLGFCKVPSSLLKRKIICCVKGKNCDEVSGDP